MEKNTSTISKAAQKDIAELKQKIEAWHRGEIPEDRFKLFRLTRGVYGQRQPGVQMIRIKIPYGMLTARQLRKIAEVSATFTNGKLHLTTRQDVQLHYVKVNDAPRLWEELEKEDVTLREACGNTVRNITASAKAGIDPAEPFDVSPYAEELFRFFLRNPVCQEMGRKIKIAFSSSEEDSAGTYFHDLGLVPRTRTENGQTRRGFKVVVAGGLGALSMVAPTAHEFLPEEELLPFAEALIRVFDRHGERASRNKARMKFLLKKIGLPQLMELVAAERKALKARPGKQVPDHIAAPSLPVLPRNLPAAADVPEPEQYRRWLATNVFEQKQKGFFGAYLFVPLGNLTAEQALGLASVVEKFAADDLRVTISQNLLLKYLRPESLPAVYLELEKLGLHHHGYGSTADITACPGTDTCNLGVSNSTQLALELEKTIRQQHPHLVADRQISIKISGCMNSCGQHMAAQIGFHGSSIKHGKLVIPAMQVVLGGGISPDGKGYVAEKIIKLPSKKIPLALSTLLDHYEETASEGEYFNDFARRLGRRHFYDLLKSLGNLDQLAEEDYVDWGHVENFSLAVGVGECAGVIYDMVGTILHEAGEKRRFAAESLAEGSFADAIYHNYNLMVVTAKALLLGMDVKCNTQAGIINDFDEHLVKPGLFSMQGTFSEVVLQLNQHEPERDFAEAYLASGNDFYARALAFRQRQLGHEHKKVVTDYYKA